MNTLLVRRGLLWIVVVLASVLVASVGQPACAELAEAPAQADRDESVDAATETSGEMKTLAVVAGARYDELIADITFLGTVTGKPEIGQMVEGGIAFFTQGKGLEAIDKTQPWGVIVQTDGAQFSAVGCLPVTKPDDLLDVAAAYGAEIKDGDEGVKEVSLPNQRSIFVKQQAGWAFISPLAELLDRLPENPQAAFAELVNDYDLGARVSVKDVPEMYRQFAIQAMQAGMQQGMQKKSEESDEQFELRQKLAEVQMEQMVRMVNDIDSVTIGWAVDAQQQRTYLDFTYLFLPGSKMATQIAAYGQPRTNFAGFYQPDAAATITFVNKADPKLIEADLAQFETMMQTVREQFNKAIDENEKITDAEAREAIKAAASDWFAAFAATVNAGQVDGGAALHAGSDSLTLVAGAFVKDPAKFESGLKKLEAAAQKCPEFPGIQWNAANHAGVNFHTLTVPVPEDQDRPRQLLGDEVTIAVGIGPETVYLAAGKDSMNAVQQAIDASAAEPNKAVPPFELAISLGPIAELAAAQAEEGSQQATAQAVAEMLRNEAQGRDHIRMVGQVLPNGLRYRFEAEEGVLRAIGKAAEEKQRQAQQAAQ